MLFLILIPLIAMATAQKCQQITIPMCKGIGYNFTQLPNQFNHDNQEEAGLEVHQYWPLVEIKCSLDLRFFICSLYVPICMEDYKGSVPVCRELCLRAREGCEPVMTHYGFTWPDRFICSHFPPFGPNSICMDERKGQLPPPTTTPPLVTMERNCSCSCKKPLVRTPHRHLGPIHNCTLPCQLYPMEGAFANYWLGFWASCCCGISLLTLLTFWVDRGRFPYPERPIVHLSTCYFFISIGYLLRVYHGHAPIACTTLDDNSSVVKETNSELNECFLVFFLVYYFTVAAGCWWVNLSISWYMASSWKWGSEAISKKYLLFHFFGWTPPLLASLVAMGSIEGDPVGGLCFVGSLHEGALYRFVLLPWGILLILGCLFLIGGFAELFRIRRVISKQTNGKTEKLEKLMIRIGVFSILYTLPSAAVMATIFYELKARKEWLAGFCSCHGNTPPKPIYEILMIRYFLTLTVGITTGGVWIWSRKTCKSWAHFFCCRNKMDEKCVYL